MNALITFLVMAFLADVLWVNARLVAEQNRNNRHELDRWTGAPGRPIPLVRPEQLALPATTAPTVWDVWEWLAATDDHPATVLGRPRYAGEADTITPQPRLRIVEQVAAG